MKRLAGCSLILTVAVLIAHTRAQDAPQSNVIDGKQLLLDLKTLSADDMQGRQVDTPGGAKARAYVVNRFKASGIKPFGTSYEAPFTFSSGRGTNQVEHHGINVVGYIAGKRQPR